jgi:hypothetical protein
MTNIGSCLGADLRLHIRRRISTGFVSRQCVTGLSGSESVRPRCGAAGRPETVNLAGLPSRRYSCVMRPLRYSINVTLDGCCDHRAIPADEDLHRHAVENLNQADALLFGRLTYEMMEAAFRPPAGTGARPDWMEPFARTIDAAKKYVVSSTLDRVDWNAELLRGDPGMVIYFFSPVVQFWTTVIGPPVSPSGGRSARNRWPSAETS